VVTTETRRPKKLSAGVAVVRRVEGEIRYLLLRVYRNWDFPKGAVEAGESPLAAATREVEEETSLRDLDFRWGETYIETAPYAGGKIARYYVAYAPSSDVTLPINPALGRPEHHGYRWVGYRAAQPLLVPRVAAVLDWAHAIVDKTA
jgi:bis(5'-nucleosidyl)-tetraphosphatase